MVQLGVCPEVHVFVAEQATRPPLGVSTTATMLSIPAEPLPLYENCTWPFASVAADPCAPIFGPSSF